MLRERTIAHGVLRSGDRDAIRGENYVQEFFHTYRVLRYAVLVDHSSVPDDLPDLGSFHRVGFFTFDLTLEGKPFAGSQIKLLSRWGPVPASDGWLITSTLRAAVFALNQALLSTGCEHQVVCRLYRGQTTSIATYMDLFSGETETLVQINHYFDRKYRTLFPIDLRFTINACDGTVKAAGQRIIAPGGLTVIDSRQFGLAEFQGYLRATLEIENLQSRIQPFMHYWADYISDAGLSKNHQSGWDPWAANVVFSRGYMPVEPDLDVTLSFWNENTVDSHPRLLLHFNRNGEEVAVERAAPTVPAGRMSYQNISELFRDVSLDGANSAFYLIATDTPLHRPNYYIHPNGTKQYVNTSHQTGSDACHWAVPTDCYQSDYLQMLERHETDPWVIQFPMLHPRFGIDTYFGLLSSTFCKITDFTFIFRNLAGEVVFTRDETVDGGSPQFMNLQDYAREHGVKVEEGLFGLAPRKGLREVPRRAISIVGFKHKDYPYMCTAPASGYEDPNLPFYIDRLNPMCHQYEYSPVQVTDRFGPGLVSTEYDTLYIVTNCSLWRKYDRECEFKLEIVDPAGKMYCAYRTIKPQSFDAFWLSELLEKEGIPPQSQYFTIWQRSNDTLLIGYHFLYRRRDHAMSADDTFGGVLMMEPTLFDRTMDGEFVPAADSPVRNTINVRR